jgi:hypothetical protein
MHDYRPVATPQGKLMIVQIDDIPASQAPYRNAVGCLTHISNSTRPDITEAVNSASLIMINPTESEWAIIKRIFRYLKGTSDFGLLYLPTKVLELTGYADADRGNYANDQKASP